MGWLLLGMAASDLSCFADFLASQKNQQQNSFWETINAYASFFVYCLMSPALHPGISDLWGTPSALSSSPTLGFFSHMQFTGHHATPEVTNTQSMWLTRHYATPGVTRTHTMWLARHYATLEVIHTHTMWLTGHYATLGVIYTHTMWLTGQYPTPGVTHTHT